MNKSTPVLEDFKAVCREEFAYLVNEFGFVEKPLPKGKQSGSYCIELPGGKFINGFAIWFWNGSLKIIVEGINWGLHADMIIETADGQKIGFGHVAAHYFKNSGMKRIQSGGQLDDVKRLGVELRQCCEPLLRGDRTHLEEALRIQREQTERLRHEWGQLPYKRDASRAEQAFQEKDYKTVVSLLLPHLERLSASEKRRLEYAQKHTK